MKLRLIGHDSRYAMEQIQLALFPLEKLEFTEDTFPGDGAVSRLSHGTDWITATAKIARNGEVHLGIARCRTGEGTDALLDAIRAKLEEGKTRVSLLLPYTEGALVEPLAIGLHACNTGGVKLGQTVAIVGAGCIGLVTLLAAKAYGATRIIVGEVRGAEALDMLQAMNTGHDGSLSTGHANSVTDMLSRLETMVLQGSAGLPLEAIRQQIASAVDIIIHLSRLRDKSRKTMEITEVVGYENGAIKLNPLYVFEEDEYTTMEKVSGSLKRTANKMVNTYKLQISGIREEL